MMEERYHATAYNRFYTDMSNVNKYITVEAKPISPPTYLKKTMGHEDWAMLGQIKQLSGRSEGQI